MTTRLPALGVPMLVLLTAAVLAAPSRAQTTSSPFLAGDSVVIARLLEAPPRVPDCDDDDAVQVVMHYTVTRVVRGAQVPTDLYATHTCPFTAAPRATAWHPDIRFQPGEVHRMWLRPAVGSADVVDPFARTPGPRWAVLGASRAGAGSR